MSRAPRARRLRSPCSFEGEPDRHRALAHGRGDPFGRAAADIADSKDTGSAGLEHRALPAGLSSGDGVGRAGGVGPGPDEAVIIELDQAAEPARTGCDPDEDEQGPGLKGPPLRGPVALYGDGFQRLVAEQF